MTTLLDFLEARLAEDEAWALAASQPYKYSAEGATVPAGGVHWTWVVGENWTPVTADPAVDDTVGGPEHYGCPVNLASVEEWPTQGSDHGWPVRTMRRTVANEMVEVDSSAAGHIARHDPARVLRDVAAKRRLLALHPHHRYAEPLDASSRFEEDRRPAFDEAPLYVGCASCHYDHRHEETYPSWWCDTVRLLALPYADHPDYRSEWSPDSVVPES